MIKYALYKFEVTKLWESAELVSKTLLKNEFDHYRNLQTVPPILQAANINLVPFHHPSLNDWRENFIGVRTHHQATGLDIAGAVDDIWVDANKVLYVVDKAFNLFLKKKN